jgi:hypothetical protein
MFKSGWSLKKVFFLKLRLYPSFCIKMMHIAFLLKSFSEALQGKYKYQTKAISLTIDICCKTYKLDEGDGHVGAHIRTSHLRTSSDNQRPHQTSNSELETQIGPANFECIPLHTLKSCCHHLSPTHLPSSVRIKALTLPHPARVHHVTSVIEDPLHNASQDSSS